MKTLLFALIITSYLLHPAIALSQDMGGSSDAGGGGTPAPGMPAGAVLSGGSFAGGATPDIAVQINQNQALSPTVANDAVIQYDPETDAIVVITDEATNRNIEQVIQTLDQPAAQVLIKVLFLEVTHSKNLDLGVQMTGSFGPVNSSTGKAEHTLTSNFGLATETRGGIYNIVTDDFTATLHALEKEGKLEVLSRPSVLARNNETANITIGQEIPFITNSRVTENGQIINTITYEDIGIIMDVTPHITRDRMVEMDVAPEISTLTGETVPVSETFDARVIAKRSAQTRVVVADGKTVVIGGLMQNTDTDTIEKVPILGDIPYLGFFFKRTKKDKAKTELIIFLTPYVVSGPEQLRDLSTSEVNRGELSQKSFTPQDQNKYIDNLPKIKEWKGKP